MKGKIKIQMGFFTLIGLLIFTSVVSTWMASPKLVVEGQVLIYKVELKFFIDASENISFAHENACYEIFGVQSYTDELCTTGQINEIEDAFHTSEVTYHEYTDMLTVWKANHNSVEEHYSYTHSYFEGVPSSAYYIIRNDFKIQVDTCYRISNNGELSFYEQFDCNDHPEYFEELIPIRGLPGA